jgi:hypothetical protein
VQLDEFATFLSARSKTELERAIGFIWFKTLANPKAETTVSEIVDMFYETRLGTANPTRLRQNLSASSKTLKGRSTNSFVLTSEAAKEQAERFPEISENNRTPAAILTPFSIALRSHIDKLKDGKTREFLIEAVSCMENSNYRAAVVFSWVGAVSVLQEYILKNKLEEFNRDAIENKLLPAPAKTIEDLRDISKEGMFIDSLARISLIDNAVKKHLKECLGRRNNCGHPTELSFSEPYVANHIDLLLHNVFAKFAV